MPLSTSDMRFRSMSAMRRSKSSRLMYAAARTRPTPRSARARPSWARRRCPAPGLRSLRSPYSLHICSGTGRTVSTSAPGLAAPFPHLHRDWPHPVHICAPGLGAWHGRGITCCRVVAAAAVLFVRAESQLPRRTHRGEVQRHDGHAMCSVKIACDAQFNAAWHASKTTHTTHNTQPGTRPGSTAAEAAGLLQRFRVLTAYSRRTHGVLTGSSGMAVPSASPAGLRSGSEWGSLTSLC
jgi:hypothetical protein